MSPFLQSPLELPPRLGSMSGGSKLAPYREEIQRIESELEALRQLSASTAVAGTKSVLVSGDLDPQLALLSAADPSVVQNRRFYETCGVTFSVESMRIDPATMNRTLLISGTISERPLRLEYVVSPAAPHPRVLQLNVQVEPQLLPIVGDLVKKVEDQKSPGLFMHLFRRVCLALQERHAHFTELAARYAHDQPAPSVFDNMLRIPVVDATFDVALRWNIVVSAQEKVEQLVDLLPVLLSRPNHTASSHREKLLELAPQFPRVFARLLAATGNDVRHATMFVLDALLR